MEQELPALAALVARQSADLEVYASFLYTALEGALPAELLTVQRQQSLRERLRGRPAAVTAVSLRLGDHLFSLRRPGVGAASQASISHEVGGIVLSTTQVGLAEWSRRLAAALGELAEHNAGAALALQRLTSFTV